MITSSWDFYAVQATTSFGFMWQWRRQGGTSDVTSAPFAFYFDCIADARENGYEGRLPLGPKEPLLHLPAGSVELSRAAAKLRSAAAPQPRTSARSAAAAGQARRDRSQG